MGSHNDDRRRKDCDSPIADAIDGLACVISKVFGKTKTIHHWVLFETGHDEPIEKGQTMEVTLKTPIKPGFRRPFSVKTDEPIDANEDGTFGKTEVVDGDSRAPEILPTSTSQQLNGWIYGDGSLGSKHGRVKVDAHVGPTEVPLTLDIFYEVAHKDATEFQAFTEGPGADEPIPA